MTLTEYNAAVAAGKKFKLNNYTKVVGLGPGPLVNRASYYEAYTVFLMPDNSVVTGTRFTEEEYAEAKWIYRGGYENPAFDDSIGQHLVAAGLVDIMYEVA